MDTKDMIREVALNLFKENGFDQVTIQKICQEAKVTKRTFYYHFESKNDLLSGVIDYLGMKAEKLLDTMVSSKTNVEVLWDLMSVYCTNSMAYGPHIIKQVYILTIEDSKNRHFPEDMYLFNIVVGLIQKAQENHEIKNMSDPTIITYSLYHILRSVSLTWASENGKTDLSEAYKKTFDIVLGMN